MLDVPTYLERIDYHGSLEPTAATLRTLHQAHMRAVPFENLDIHLGRPILLDRSALFEKIVVRKRGGFCYELNGLFAALLQALGFDVTMLSASVARPQGGFGPEFDHLTLLVQLEELWLADVGFGDSFHEPLLFDTGAIQSQNGHAYRLDYHDERWTLLRSDGTSWEAQYTFTLYPRQHTDFTAMCHYHQTSLASSFTRQRICSRATTEGRITLSDRSLIITEHGKRTEQQLSSEEEFQAVLRERFGLDLSTDTHPAST